MKRLELYYATDRSGWGCLYGSRPRWDVNGEEYIGNLLCGYELPRELGIKPGKCKKVTIIVEDV